MRQRIRPLVLAIVPGLTLLAAAAPPQAGRTSRAAGTVEHIKVHGAALEGNLEADSPDRDGTIYLPPGYAAERLRRYPVLYLMSACCLNPQTEPRPDAAMAASAAIRTRDEAVEAAKGRGFGPSLNLALAAAWSPNPANPPLYLDLPVNGDQVRPDILA